MRWPSLLALAAGLALTPAPALTPSQRALLASVAPAYQCNYLSGALCGGEVDARASTATYIACATGNLATAAVNAARFDCAGGAARGWLVEASATNLALQSNAFSAWSALNASVASAATASPDGATDGWSLADNSTSGQHSLYQQVASVSGSTYAVTFYLKQNSLRYAQVGLGDGTNQFNALFDLQAGAEVATSAAGSPTNTTFSIMPAGSGWYRASVSMKVSSTTAYPSVNTANSAAPAYSAATGAAQYVGSGNSVFVYGGQMQLAAPDSYIPTTSAAVARAADLLSATGALASAIASGPSIVEYAPEATGAVTRVLVAKGGSPFPSGDNWVRRVCAGYKSTAAASSRLSAYGAC